MKFNSGITMVELLVVIIIVVMIATFAINSGTDTLDEADVTEVFVEITSVKTAMNSIALKREVQENFQILQGGYYDEKFVPAPGVTYGDNVLGFQEDWFIIYGLDAPDIYNESNVRTNLGLDTLNHSYIVNFDTSEVELYMPVTIKDLSVRTYKEIRELAE